VRLQTHISLMSLTHFSRQFLKKSHFRFSCMGLNDPHPIVLA
jgi:hypothetical protein